MMLRLCSILAVLAVLAPGAWSAQGGAEDWSAPRDPQSTSRAEVRLAGRSAAERGAALVRYVATCKPKPADETYPKAAAPAYAARLLLNLDTNYALRGLDAAVTSRITQARQERGRASGNPLNPPGLDPFDKVALVNTYFLCRDKIPRTTALKIREYTALYAHRVWRGYGAMNYRLMMDGAGFLAAEEWPELVDVEGLTAEGIRQATRERLFGYFNTICRSNFDEYGAPIYLGVDLSAVRMLAEFAREAEMRKRATFALDAMMVDIACTWNQGYNVGSASRAKYWVSTDTGPENMGSTAAAAWVFFGAARSISAAGTGWIHSFWMATPGHYEVPELVVEIAQDRAQPFVHRSSVPAAGPMDIHRMTYHSPNYGLCSQWDHPPDPTSALYKESRRHQLKWVSDQGSSTFAVCMENPYRPYNLQENRANVLGYGENPHSQYLQDEGTLIGVYAVPAAFPYFRLYAPFTTQGAMVKRASRAGWVFGHNGSMLMGFHSVSPCTWGSEPWNGCDLLWCEARTNAWVLETTELKPFAGGGVDAELDRFAAAVLGRARVDASRLHSPQPRLRYTALSGRTLDLTWVPHGVPYAGHSSVDGVPVDYHSWPLLTNRWVFQPLDSPRLTLSHAGRRLTFDFANWTREAEGGTSHDRPR